MQRFVGQAMLRLGVLEIQRRCDRPAVAARRADGLGKWERSLRLQSAKGMVKVAYGGGTGRVCCALGVSTAQGKGRSVWQAAAPSTGAGGRTEAARSRAARLAAAWAGGLEFRLV